MNFERQETPTLPFIPSEQEMLLLRALEAGHRTFTLPDALLRALDLAVRESSDGLGSVLSQDRAVLDELTSEMALFTQAAVSPADKPSLRVIRDALVSVAMRRLTSSASVHGTYASRLFNRSLTARVVAETAVRVLGFDYANAGLVGLTRHLGELWIVLVLERLSPHVPADELIRLSDRYGGDAGADLASDWNLPADVVHACREARTGAGAQFSVRLARIAGLLTEPVEGIGSGKTPHWNDALASALGLSRERARHVVQESARVLSLAS